jgi:hypothetical protein
MGIALTTRLDETVPPSRRRSLWQLVVFLGCAAVVGKYACAHMFCKTQRSSVFGPAPLAQGDVDQDGLLDSEEDALAERFAPIVVLHREDSYLPASIPWLSARADVFGERSRTVIAGSAIAGSPRIPADVHKGSPDSRDWTTYVHVYPRADGGLNLQYWFYYPFSNGPLFFDHDSDWEHVTIELDARGNPVAAHLAQHENDHPGHFHAFDKLRKQGDHIVVYSARGTHATYADHRDTAWFEEAAACTDVERCGDVVWRTWQGGGLENLGERARPRVADRAFSMRDRWGGSGLIPGTSAPRGPLYHRGFCVDGVHGCLEEVDPSFPTLSSLGRTRGAGS